MPPPGSQSGPQRRGLGDFFSGVRDVFSDVGDFLSGDIAFDKSADFPTTIGVPGENHTIIDIPKYVAFPSLPWSILIANLIHQSLHCLHRLLRHWFFPSDWPPIRRRLQTRKLHPRSFSSRLRRQAPNRCQYHRSPWLS